MNKIIIIGTTGSGKSTLAKALAKKLNLPYIQLDFLYWKPYWQGSSDEEFCKKIETAIASAEGWIIDGNYTRTNHLTWSQADTIIWIDLPFWFTFYQNLKRSIKRAIKHEELWEGTENRETFSRMFSKDSILLWLIKTYKQNITKNSAKMKDHLFSHLKFYRLRSRKEIDNFINSL